MRMFNKFISCLIITSVISSTEGFAAKHHQDEERRSLPRKQRLQRLSQKRERPVRTRHPRKYRIKTAKMDEGLRNDLRALGIKRRKYSPKHKQLNDFMFGLQVVEDTLVAAPQSFRNNHPVLTPDDQLQLAKMEDRARAARDITKRTRNHLKKHNRFPG